VSAPHPRHRTGAVALATAAVLFLLYPATRPWTDESTLEGAQAAMASGWWVASHLFAMLGFILAALGVLALSSALAATPAAAQARAAVVVTWVGAGLTLPYYGAEDFGLHAVARTASANLLDMVEEARFTPVAVTMFGLGLLGLAVGAVLVALAVWRSGTLPRAAGLLYGLGFALFLPQFYGPPAVRIAHGVLMLAGCAGLAAALIRRRS
jgi:hypothetical protein